MGSSAGAGARAGPRIELFGGLASAQLTADAVAFFTPRFSPGGGATLSAGFMPLSFLEFLFEGSARFLDAPAGYASRYFLAGVAIRVRWPFAQL
ncbi:MAG: hypothetical protein QM723_02790 [Myxococcaceae bacterium]